MMSKVPAGKREFAELGSEWDHRVTQIGSGSPTISLDTQTALTMDHDMWRMDQPPNQCQWCIQPYLSWPNTCACRPLETGNLPIWPSSFRVLGFDRTALDEDERTLEGYRMTIQSLGLSKGTVSYTMTGF